MIQTPARIALFEKAMYDTYHAARALKYNARDYKVLLDRYGAPETARRCILKPDGLPSGVLTLMEMGHPEISVEAVVCQFADLFADEPGLVAVANERLRWMSDPAVQARARALREWMQSPTSR
jgi:hypothetical protein